MSEISWQSVDDGRTVYDWDEGIRRRISGESVMPRYNGKPCRWYICAFCDWQVQMGESLIGNEKAECRELRACGRYILHKCTPGLRADVQALAWSRQPGYAYICAPWQAINGLRALHQ